MTLFLRPMAFALVLIALTGSASAQDFSFDPSGSVLDECLGSTPDRVGRMACIGKAAEDCLRRYGWATPVESACLNGEADYWQSRLNFLGYPSDLPGAVAAARAWDVYVEAECALAAEGSKDTTGYASVLAECRLNQHALRNMQMEESGWSR